MIAQTTIAPAVESADGTWQQGRGSQNNTGLQRMKGSFSASPYLKWEFFGPGNKGSGMGGGEGEPVIGDINGDGRNEVICSNGDTLFAINGTDGTFVWSSSIQAGPASAVITDVNSDGAIDVVVSGTDQKIYALRGSDGAIIWSYFAGGPLYYTPVAGDLNGDGKIEIVFTAGNAIIALNGADGSVFWTFNGPPNFSSGSFTNISGCAIGDITGDGNVEVVGIIKNSKNGPVILYALNGSIGSVIWSFSFMNSSVMNSPAIGDLNNDCIKDVLVNINSQLYAFNGLDGTILWNTFSTTLSFAAIADINGDCAMEIITSGGIYKGTSGERLFGFMGVPGDNLGNGWFAPAPKIGDFDPGSTGLEIIFSTAYDTLLNRIYMFSSKGIMLWNYHLPNHTYEGVAVGDIDNDDCMEIVASPDAFSGPSSIIALDDINNARACGSIAAPIPAAFIGDTLVCPGELANFSANNASCVTSWSWSFQEGSPSSSTLKEPDGVYYSNRGTYEVLLITVENGCIDTLRSTIAVDGPTADFGYEKIPCTNQIQFINLSSDTLSSFWDFGDGTTSNENDPSHAYHTNEKYTVILIMNPYSTCTDTVQKEITFENDAVVDTLFIPNVFTPNGDGKNEYFEIIVGDNPCISLHKLMIFNRWGLKVFETEGTELKWNGMINGNVLTEGIYFYILEGEGFNKTGSVTLLR